ncbi:MAG TPA: glycosyl hydrolase [Lachnospiraceae bacterium]|nr:glycosyl hydrolase [Lachnospiraceae bacterium]
MYDDGKKSFLGNILYSILWLGGLALLIFIVYKIGFGSVAGTFAEGEAPGENDSEQIVIAEAEDSSAGAPSQEEAGMEEIEASDEEPEAEEPPAEEPSVPEDEDAAVINAVIANMSTEAKVAQLFFITPEQLTGVDKATVFGDMSAASFAERPVGGLIYSKGNLESPDQTKEMLAKADECSRQLTSLPLFIGIDEEGGSVLKLASNPAFNLEQTPSMKELSGESVEDAVYHAADQIGQYLKEYGFNVDLAPVADLVADPENSAIGDRSFGDDAELTAKLCADYSGGLHNNNILSCYKHFPGHGSTMTEDSHDGPASSARTLEELRSADLVPFIDGSSGKTDFIMTGHISFKDIPESEGLPASLSYFFNTELLRHEIGYEGIIITDALNMKAITSAVNSADASVKAFQAGCDMLLTPEDFETAYQALLQKINSGDISEDRLNESVYRIIKAKLKLLSEPSAP